MPTELPVLPDLASCCAPATGGRIDDASAESLARMFKALADPNRVKLLSLIAASSGQEACVCDLTAPIGLAQPTISHHMKVLTEAGLVEREQRGKWAYFSLVPGILESLAEALSPRR
ncbi:helix-turn-helix transcriptional regulator [Nocardioides humilatus]|uniref:Helix-turn-helix transcriptional regulator n=1 Tax=Nocardioides humilatus TaxID=2607660 RepID=A0A5B1LJK8_9ACTN|nr:metalloregulator ArsR/SmtB family transcription factor [Nocardioides humilatus]KAA1420915.1 helix-turn-helix transcriptional regulator [Nocardioides humilatus]